MLFDDIFAGFVFSGKASSKDTTEEEDFRRRLQNSN